MTEPEELTREDQSEVDDDREGKDGGKRGGKINDPLTRDVEAPRTPFETSPSD